MPALHLATSTPSPSSVSSVVLHVAYGTAVATLLLINAALIGGLLVTRRAKTKKGSAIVYIVCTSLADIALCIYIDSFGVKADLVIDNTIYSYNGGQWMAWAAVLGVSWVTGPYLQVQV